MSRRDKPNVAYRSMWPYLCAIKQHVSYHKYESTFRCSPRKCVSDSQERVHLFSAARMKGKSSATCRTSPRGKSSRATGDPARNTPQPCPSTGRAAAAHGLASQGTCGGARLAVAGKDDDDRDCALVKGSRQTKEPSYLLMSLQ